MFWMILIVFVALVVALSGFGLLFGLAVNWLVPSVEMGSGAIFGLLTAGISAFYTFFIVRAVERRIQEEDELEETSKSPQAQRKRRGRKS